jgi:hypothetical protein
MPRTSPGDIRTLMMGTEMVPETSVSSYNQLTLLIGREYFVDIFLCFSSIFHNLINPLALIDV